MIAPHAARPILRRRFGHAGAVLGWGVLGGLGFVGCGSSGGTSPSGAGSLTVTITASAGVTPSVAVSGPAGYRQSLSATQTLSGIAVGSYTVTAALVVVPNPIVATVDTATVTGGAATVSAGATATASVSYAARPGSGALWVANAPNALAATVLAYAAAQLAASTQAAPTTALATEGGQLGAAFDASGTLWLSTPNVIGAVPADQLATSGIPSFAVILGATGGSLNFPAALAFDASGTLWVANNGGNTVVAFAPNQLTTSGSPTPAVTLSSTGGSLNGPIGVAFDASSNLWVANNGGNTVVEFTASQLGSTGGPTPAVTLSATAGSLNGPAGLAFDASGTLWVANNLGNTVVALASGQLGSTGSPSPVVTVRATGGSLNGPFGVAFDASGGLWVTNPNGNTIVQFAASQLVLSGAPTPNVIVGGSSLAGPAGLAFDPSAAMLPLQLRARAGYTVQIPAGRLESRAGGGY